MDYVNWERLGSLSAAVQSTVPEVIKMWLTLKGLPEINNFTLRRFSENGPVFPVIGGSALLSRVAAATV